LVAEILFTTSKSRNSMNGLPSLASGVSFTPVTIPVSLWLGRQS